LQQPNRAFGVFGLDAFAEKSHGSPLKSAFLFRIGLLEAVLGENGFAFGNTLAQAQ
jgi:hypothetical protein